VLEDEADVQVASLPPDLPSPDDPSLPDHSWSGLLMRKATFLADGTMGYWIRLDADMGDDPADHQCALAFMSDAAPSRAARSAHPDFAGDTGDRRLFQGASLDHSVWFQRPTDPSQWHWFATRSHGVNRGRGLVTGDVIRHDGLQVATIAQEVLVRRRRETTDGT